MSIQKKNVLKMCSFYVSDWHNVTMLLPYINNEINKGAKIIPILEKSIEENVQTLVKKLNLKNRDNILDINWNKVNGLKYSNFSNIVKIKNEKELVFVLNGSKEYINKTNENIKKYIEKNKINLDVKIIDFYEVTDFNNSIKEILDEHDKILNTSGEKEIEEVFKGYKKDNLLKEAN